MIRCTALPSHPQILPITNSLRNCYSLSCVLFTYSMSLACGAYINWLFIHGFLIDTPDPLHLVHATYIDILAYLYTTEPRPPQFVHLPGAVPGLHLDPLQVVHVPTLSILIDYWVPLTESINGISKFTYMSYPFIDRSYSPPIPKNDAKSLNTDSSNSYS